MNVEARYAPRHGKPEELTPEDVDSTLVMPEDAIIGAHSHAEIVFVGPVGVGKTTAVRALSTSTPVSSEVKASTTDDFIVGGKETTTVGIEMGVWERLNGQRVALYGTAGQDRFDASRTPALNPEAGIVLMLFGYEHLLKDQVQEWVGLLGEKRALHRTVIGVNFLAPGQEDPIPRIKQLLQDHGQRDVPVQMVDPRNVFDVADIAEAALKRVEECQ
ncbi:hypothetical protein QP994_07520 [Corynebacterium sp. MSK044]|uniref:hypothetical protein n=1 Tax=Corynebacterium sp. MSK044 TaxID=3050195 RepID=UPI00254BE39C|nr:hypothetical protein [Corynebacterium sp. MSK044]MDK8797731.1 hypothetical protein [Corynebacterium sp. MSK044]